MKIFAIILTALICLSGCQTTREMRKSNRCARKLERLVNKCPEIARTDTIRDTVMVQVPAIVHDTVVLKADTIEVSKDRWWTKIVTVKDSVFITGGCDTDTLYVPVEIPCETLQPTKYESLPLKWWQLFLICCGALLILKYAYKLALKSFKAF